MERRVLGATGLRVSVLGFGSAPIGFQAIERERAGRVVNELLDMGVNLLDTAAAYPGSEEALGETVGHRRDEFVLVSKCGQAFDGLPGEAWSAEVIAATIDRSLQRLRTDHLDVMLLHGCDREVLARGEAVGALVAAREAGKIRFCGYSGDNDNARYALTLPDIAVLETSVNVVDQANLVAVLPAAAARPVGVIAKRPLANSAWRGADNLPGFYSDYGRTYSDRFEAMGLALADLGLGESVTWAEVALRFTLGQPGVTCAIAGTTNPDNARLNVAHASQPALPAGADALLKQAFARAAAAEEDGWPGQN